MRERDRITGLYGLPDIMKFIVTTQPSTAEPCIGPRHCMNPSQRNVNTKLSRACVKSLEAGAQALLTDHAHPDGTCHGDALPSRCRFVLVLVTKIEDASR